MKKREKSNMGRSAARGYMQKLVVCALLVAISIVMGKYAQIPVGQALRFSFENFPIILCGFAFGPLWGAVVGIVADLVGCILVGYAINPIITLGAAAVGAVSGVVGLCRRAVLREKLLLWVALAEILSHLCGSVAIKTFGLASFYSMPLWELMLWRLLNYTIVATAEIFIMYYLLKNRMFSANINKLGGKL